MIVAEAGEGPGAALQAAREAQQLSVPQVADQLKLSSAVVTALEANDWDRLPAQVFVRGYVRAYARLMGLDDEELLDSERGATGGEVRGEFSVIHTLEGRRGLVWWITGAVAALAAAIAGALAMFSDR
ncbi:MAG: helix-turn-helix domain-containing protein [Gammaproteobacteria bacterium]|nr:helix-turn-helix domain-containing protein [Gammaproteobacteria bacterium]MYE50039.1 helix-turn-helix domain-containing protein [Gammaproteobacteria bacterium]MYF52095.1 helix-turn-helix domain-containing protein [Gammaproteobacteria bacterium]